MFLNNYWNFNEFMEVIMAQFAEISRIYKETVSAFIYACTVIL